MREAISKLSNKDDRLREGISKSDVNDTNVHGWNYKAKKYLRYHGISDDERITVATFNMEGEALD